MTWDVHQIELQDDLQQYNSKGGLATPTRTHEQNKNLVSIIQHDAKHRIREGFHNGSFYFYCFFFCHG
jgi:hypothetical protein